MAGITLAQAEAKLTAWMAAEDALQTTQEYAIGTRRLRKADLAEVRETIRFWNDMVVRLSRGGIRITGGTPT